MICGRAWNRIELRIAYGPEMSADSEKPLPHPVGFADCAACRRFQDHL